MKDELERKIRSLISEALISSDLSPEEGFVLHQRLMLARTVIEAILQKPDLEMLSYIDRIPEDFADQAQIREWLLIDFWALYGEGFLEDWADSFLAGIVFDEKTDSFRWEPPESGDPSQQN